MLIYYVDHVKKVAPEPSHPESPPIPHLPGLAGTLASETWYEYRMDFGKSLISEIVQTGGPNCQVQWHETQGRTFYKKKNIHPRNLHEKNAFGGSFFSLPIFATGCQLSTSDFWGKEFLMPLGIVATYLIRDSLHWTTWCWCQFGIPKLNPWAETPPICSQKYVQNSGPWVGGYPRGQ